MLKSHKFIGFLPPANEVWGKVIFYTCSQCHSVHGGGGVPGHYHPPPVTRYTPWDKVCPPDQVHPSRPGTPPGPGTSPRTRCIPWDQVHPPGTRYTPWTRYIPRTRCTPWDQVHPPGTRYTPWDQVHPLHQVHHHPPPPGTRYTPPPLQSMLGDTVNARAVRILLECNLVQDACLCEVREATVHGFGGGG